MADLLLELFSEEIPARMQARAADDLQKLVTDGLKEGGLSFAAAHAESGPRRLVLHLEGLPERSADVREERKGPRVGAPEKAVEGFLRAAGLKSLDECETRDDGKGAFYVAVIEKPGQPAADIIARVAPEAVRKFPWPKSMRWGASRLRWVRPLHSVLCLLDGKVVPFEIDGVKSGGVTWGHRRSKQAAEGFAVRDYADYGEKLRAANVVLARGERVRAIADQARQLAGAESLALVEDDALVEENAGLAEWPVVLAGSFDESFLEVPQEVLITSMKAHQKCFSLRQPGSGALANRFLMVANQQAQDGGKAIIAGNERVIRARLSDAKFFWDNDRKRSLDSLLPTLDQITFHEKLGTQGERVKRLMRLAREIAPLVGADPDKAERAAQLCKADLVSETVGEFPELQGVIGRYIALEQGEDAEIAAAISDHYKPAGQSDSVPTDPVSIAAALADKLDMLVSFWAIDEKPTGSKDPYGLRRSALGVVRTILENKLRIDLTPVLIRHADNFPGDWASTAFGLIAFLGDRLKVQLRENGARYDLVDAVFEKGLSKEQVVPGMENVRDLLMIVRRVEALGRFLATDDGANLLTGVKRGQNILRIEEKKDKRDYAGTPDAALLKEPQEKALAKAIREVTHAARERLDAEDFEGAMSALARLRAPVDAFFDKVTVNAPDEALRENRLKLLSQIRAATLEVADFSKIEG